MSDANDANTTLQDLKDLIGNFAEERDWRKFHSLKNLAMAITSEAAELMAHFRWSDAEAEAAAISDPTHIEQIRHELADVMMLLAEFANVAGIDIAGSVREKQEINLRRYPVEKSRGVATKYDRL